MEQREFTDYVIPKILEYFPQFAGHCFAKPGDVVDIEYKSNAGLLMLWITTQDKEITIGLSGDHDLFDFHTHMSLYGANTPNEELLEAQTIISDIITDKTPITYSAALGYTIADINEVRGYQQPGEIISATYWSKL